MFTAAERLPDAQCRKPFISSSSAMDSDDAMKNDYATPRNMLQSKWYVAGGKFSCKVSIRTAP